MNHSETVSFFWGAANLIRDTFTHGKYQEVNLPHTVSRRLDCAQYPEAMEWVVRLLSIALPFRRDI